MTTRFAGSFAAALALAVAMGCGTTAPSRFYTLASTAAAGGAAPVSAGVMVGPVSVPASVDRPEFVVQVAPNRVEVDEFNRWAAPLGEAIARTVATDLAALLGTPDVATAPFANFDPVYRVTINVQRFDSVQGEAALLEAVWTRDTHVTDRSVDTLIKRLRQKIEADTASPRYILTVWGTGYKFADG